MSNVKGIHICNAAMYGYSEPTDMGEDDAETFCIDINMADMSKSDMVTYTRISANAKGNVVETALQDEILAFLEK